MNLASKKFRAVAGIVLCFLAGGVAFAVVLKVVGLANGGSGASAQLILAGKREAGSLNMPVLSDAQPALTWNLKDHAGKVVVVNYFATWCGPCNDEVPDLKSIYQEFNGRGVDFVMVGLDRDEEHKPPETRETALRDFAARHAVPMPILLPAKGADVALKSDLIPQTYVYDQKGRLARWIQGGIDPKDLRQTLDALRAE